MQTILETIRSAAAYLKEKGIDHSRREVEELLGHVLKLPRLQLYLQYDKPLMVSEQTAFQELLERRVAREPLQYIVGQVEFLDCSLNVDARVLIPRPETELLASKMSRLIQGEGVLLDLCCGSGCLAIALKKKYPQLTVMAIDLSAEALALAKQNSEKNAVDIRFVCSDLTASVPSQSVDYCVCNPPYISSHEISTLQEEVKNFEPHLALEAGEDGLSFYRRLAIELPRVLKSGAKVGLEIGASQGSQVMALFEKKPWKECRLEKDWAGQDRFIFLVIE